MSITDRAVGFVRTMFTVKEQLDALGRDVSAMSGRLTRLAEAHGDLRDRVSRLEGIIEGAALVSRQRRIEE